MNILEGLKEIDAWFEKQKEEPTETLIDVGCNWSALHACPAKHCNTCPCNTHLWAIAEEKGETRHAT